MNRAHYAWVAATGLALAAFAVSLGVGSLPLSPARLWGALTGSGDEIASAVVLDLRLPRALAAFGVGGLLALAGALMQVLLRNPLADPYVLGLSGGAAVGALAAMLLGAAASVAAGAAGLGALASVGLVLALARRDLAFVSLRGGAEASPRLLLTGMSLAIGWSAIVTLILTLASDVQLRGMLFWLVGDLAGAQGWGPALVVLALALALVPPFARDLNVLAHGAAGAHALGVAVGPLRWGLCVVASTATAVAVTTAGPIGFVGLIVPHALRLAVGNDQRVLLPACALGGGTVLLFADTLARTAFAPMQLPAGVVTAILGVPAFLLLLLRPTRGGS